MANICEITGKHVISGNTVSHANNKNKRKFYPNLQKKRFFFKELNTWIVLSVCTKAMRTIGKNGLYHTLKKASKRGTLISRISHLIKTL